MPKDGKKRGFFTRLRLSSFWTSGQTTPALRQFKEGHFWGNSYLTTGPKQKTGEKGQASILIGMMMLTFILFFGFAVNTGMLINAKINLQNAADLAAYAGAAQQARLLTNISYLNYEMRRQYKKFLFRYYVIGNMAQDSFPKGPANGPVPWRPSRYKDITYQVPVVCIIYNGTDNYCHMTELPQIMIPPATPLDAINTTLVNQLEQIEQIRLENCKSIGSSNAFVLLLWLFNSDPDLSKLSLSGKYRDFLQVTKGLTYGLGLVPRELILRWRIDTLNSYINAPPEIAVTRERVNTLKNFVDPIAKERTVDAFLSAYNTLGNNTFADDNEIIMDELIPPQLSVLKDIKTRFDTYALDYELINTGHSPRGANCQPMMRPVTLPAELTLGVYKDPSVLTYYALRLKAKARVLFSPFGDMELKAYAAAQPFGSRIGPELSAGHFLRSGVANPSPRSLDLVGSVPNLPILSGDPIQPTRGTGFDNQAVSGVFYAGLQAGPYSLIDQTNFNRGYQVAMVPNPWEKGKYNIINDLGEDYFVSNFDKNRIAAFWAPVFPLDKKSNLAGSVSNALDALFPPSTTSGSNVSQSDLDNMRSQLKSVMTQYMTRLESGDGEVIGGIKEGFNIVRLEDPFSTRPGDPKAPTPIPINLPGTLLMNSPQDVKTSWDNTKNNQQYAKGRVGYSVKIVSFESLTNRKQPANSDGTGWMNELTPGAEGDEDLPYIRH
ncbi:MAG: hypothetical protein A2603_12455 [Bdellovibrionales bacterium RIFOXYD1_FULL_55_31]|nr:MAG: hypothetical protein A2603_12455 [Bdellovibrionales bacterium RIFOXYD1_FULL_55_31]